MSVIKIIHGPTYQYQGETLDKPTVIYVRDHHYNEQDQCFHLQRLLNGSTEHTVIFDHVVQHNEFLTDPVYFPALMAREVNEFKKENLTANWTKKFRAFNFMINKLRPHRLCLLNLVDEFKLQNYSHSLCWKTSPVPSIPTTNYYFDDQLVLEHSALLMHRCNSEYYREFLQMLVFEPSVVSLVTEPAYYEKETIITEKTVMSIWGGTIPIWVGGWKIPMYMKQLGFDIFEDLVDHSYQGLEDPYQRCRSAIEQNLEFLKNPTQPMIQRLEHNLRVLQSNPWLTQVNNLIKIYPDLRRVWPA